MSVSSEKQKSVFGNKDTNRLRSPDQLQNYISVTSPSIWVVLGAIVVFLLGVLGWCVFGRIPLTVDTVAVANQDSIVCLVKVDSIAEVSPGNTVKLGDADTEYSVAAIENAPTLVDESTNQHICKLGALNIGEYVYEVTLQGTCAPGIYSAQITTGYLSPLTFIIN